MRTNLAVIGSIVIALVTALARVTDAEMSRNVISAFKGQLVITKQELGEGKTDKETIAKIKAERVSELTGETRDDITSWEFHYTAFLSKTGATNLDMKFYRDGKLYVADKRLDGVDPKSPVLTGSILINEDEGLDKGKSYVIKLVNSADAVVAQATLVMK